MDRRLLGGRGVETSSTSYKPSTQVIKLVGSFGPRSGSRAAITVSLMHPSKLLKSGWDSTTYFLFDVIIASLTKLFFIITSPSFCFFKNAWDLKFTF